MSLANILNAENNHSSKQLSSFQPGTRKKLEHFSYDLSEIIGKGYSSQVFKGKNDQTNEPVAIKVIDMKMLKCEVNRTLLSNEIDNLKLLNNSPNILQLFEVYTTKNNTYLITQLCQSDLSKKIKKRMEENQAFSHIQQLIDGYMQLFRKEIIHRDLKPANVLIKDNTLKIADLGFSIKAKEALKPSKYNVGSPLYMAPESLKKNEYSFKSDIWALGVIFYQMIFHHAPWKAKNQKELLKKIESQGIKTLIVGNISPISRQFLIRTLSIDKDQRLSPEQLQEFSFKIVSIPSEITINSAISKPFREKNMNEQKLNCTVAPSITPEMAIDIVNNYKTNKLGRSAEKSEKRQKSNRQNRKKIFESIQQISKEERKQVTKILISQVHFCRFLFKLNERIKKQTSIRFADQLRKCYASAIMAKIAKVKDFENFNFLAAKHYEEYKNTHDFIKIKKIGKQYYIRYSEQIGQDLTDIKYDPVRIIKATEKVVKHLSKDLKQTVTIDNINQNCAKIIVLDYLITTYQLFGLIRESQDYHKFARKSKIEQIVEGTPTNITMNHFNKIIEKIEDLKLA